MDPSPPTHVGPYRLLHLLGRGGSAAVYAAEHESEGQRVALKLLSPGASRDLVNRFLQGAEVLTRVHHPGIVRILGSARQGDTVFLTMEYLDGLSLREWMRRRTGPAPLGTILELGARIADILVEVHAQGIVHRDLKPENVFLCPEEGSVLGHRVKLLDFGIAKLPPVVVDAHGTTQAHTHESAFIGTYPYMAPEQFRSAARVDASADVYALGVVLFELLAGRVPFMSEDPIEVLSAHVREEPPSLRQLVPSLPPGLCVFITSMLAKEPSRRPSMRRCHDMLRRAWEDEPDACPVPGLAPFTEAQAELFFGRDEEIQTLLSLLGEIHSGTRRWLQVEGSSGVGKSSLLQAGVLPRLAQAPGWRVVCVRPRDEPIRALARALASGPLPLSEGETPETVERVLRSGAGALRDFALAHVPEGARLLLVIEPLEEVFTLGAAECLGVDVLLSTALEAPGSPVRLLTGVRADFLHRIEQVPTLARLLPGAARFPLLPMTPAALTEVIHGMARHTGLRLEPGLASRMVQDARNEVGCLPLLGHALRGLWLSGGGAPLTHSDYERLGGVGGALAQQAEALLDGLGPEGRTRARWMVLSLVRTGRGVPDTRRPRSRRDVLAAGGDDARAEQVLLRLSGLSPGDSGTPAGLRLIQLSVGDGAAEPRVDLVHELLLHRVRSIAAWIEEERTLLERQADLEAAAHVWHQAGRPVEGLPTGTLLAHYREGVAPFLDRSRGSRRADPEVMRFLQAARQLERRRALSRKLMAAAAGLALLAILFSATLAYHRGQLAQDSLRQLVATTDEFVGKSDWNLSWLPYTLELREAMLRGFRSALEQLTPEQRESLEVRKVFIKLIHRQADLAYHDGRLAQASRYLEEAEAMLGAALDRWPQDEVLLFRLALNHSKRGKVELARGHLELACGHFDEAVRQLERPREGGQSFLDDGRTRAVSDAELAECRIAARRWDDAAGLLDEAARLHARDVESLGSRRDEAYYNEALLAQVLGRRAEVAFQAGQRDVARASFDQALRKAQHSLDNAPPGDQHSRWVLAQVLAKNASFQLDEGQREAAVRGYQQARKHAEELLAGEPRSKRYALVWLEAVAGQAVLEPGQASGLQKERCDLASEFRSRDGEDVRFMFADCPEARPSVERP